MTEYSRSGSEEPAARALGRLLRESGGERSESSPEPELERLLHTVNAGAAERKRMTPWLAWGLAAAAFAVVALFGAVEWQRGRGAALTFSTNGVPRSGPAAIDADPARATDLEFSDGSVFNVEPAARLRVESSSATGARLTLVEGTTVAHVVHRAKTSWSVTAGPFEVQVTGTRFGASWDTLHGRLSVELYEGSVQVVGGSFGAPISVRAGQRLEAGKGPGDWVLTSLDGPTSALATARSTPAVPAPRPVASEEAPAVDPSTSVVAGGAPAPSRSTAARFDWPEMLGRADFDGIVRQANEFGIERCLSSCSSGDLRMLADSARYLGRYGLANRSLLALRKRSPGDAATAAFLLARLEESHDRASALSWYDRYLEEAPGGTYAAEARSGKTRIIQQTKTRSDRP